MEKPKRAQRRKPDTAKADLEPRVYAGGQGVHRKVESEGPAEVSACSDAADLALLHALIKSFEMTAEDGCGFFGREQFNYF